MNLITQWTTSPRGCSMIIIHRVTSLRDGYISVGIVLQRNSNDAQLQYMNKPKQSFPTLHFLGMGELKLTHQELIQLGTWISEKLKSEDGKSTYYLSIFRKMSDSTKWMVYQMIFKEEKKPLDYFYGYFDGYFDAKDLK